MTPLLSPPQVDYSVIASQAGATLNNLLSHAQDLVVKLRSLQLDQREFVCLKFLVLFSLGESLFALLFLLRAWPSSKLPLVKQHGERFTYCRLLQRLKYFVLLNQLEQYKP